MDTRHARLVQLRICGVPSQITMEDQILLEALAVKHIDLVASEKPNVYDDLKSAILAQSATSRSEKYVAIQAPQPTDLRMAIERTSEIGLTKRW